MSRPDPARIQRNALDVIGNAGETATVRQYISGTTGTPKYGAATTFNYIERVVTGLFASTLFGAPRPNERDLAGGQAQNADMLFTTTSALGAQDEIIWRGTAYRVAGATMPENLGGRVLFRQPLRLANKTG